MQLVSIMDIHGYPSLGGSPMDAVLGKWGNSKALRVPSELCSQLGIDVGSVAKVTVNESARSLTFSFEAMHQAYSRSKRMTMEEFAAGWEGPKVGKEWGGSDVGAEVIE